eukprot:gene20062-10057_t
MGWRWSADVTAAHEPADGGWADAASAEWVGGRLRVSGCRAEP